MRRENPVWNASHGAEAQTRTQTVNRRVRVTARSRQSQAPVEKHAPELVTEIAAPSSFNGPQHAPSPTRLTQSADGSRANWRMTTESVSRTGAEANRGRLRTGFLPFAFLG
jgi:hypothetical protein